MTLQLLPKESSLYLIQKRTWSTPALCSRGFRVEKEGSQQTAHSALLSTSLPHSYTLCSSGSELRMMQKGSSLSFVPTSRSRCLQVALCSHCRLGEPKAPALRSGLAGLGTVPGVTGTPQHRADRCHCALLGLKMQLQFSSDHGWCCVCSITLRAMLYL